MRVEGARRIGNKGTVKVRLAFDDWKDGHVAPATFELPVPKRKDAEALRANLGTFEMRLDPPARPGGPGGLRLVTDPKQADPKAAPPAVAIREKQAAAIIDYLDENRMFDDMYDPPPGFPPPGWFVSVGGAPRFGGQWRFPADADPASVGLFRHLLQTLDGDAKAAVERLLRAGPAPKK